MALKAAARCLLVQPSEKDSRLIVVREDQQPVYRGVVLHVGAGAEEDVECGNVVFYSGFHEVEGGHVVPIFHLLAIEDGS